MAHFAKIEDGIVTDVIVAEQSFIDSGAVGSGWIQTSYNTHGGVHYSPDGKPDSGTALRKNYAAIGDHYDAAAHAFYSRQPYPSWTLDRNTFLWTPPVPYPDTDYVYYWNEVAQCWQEIGSK